MSDFNPPDPSKTEHEHRFTILIGHAPITMAAGKRLPEFRACRCGKQELIGSIECGGQ